jgi:hypothetical protein
VFPNASLAVTAVLNDDPAVVVDGADTWSTLAAAAFTITAALPVIDPVAVSVAVIDSEPAVFNVMVKVWIPASLAVKV